MYIYKYIIVLNIGLHQDVKIMCGRAIYTIQFVVYHLWYAMCKHLNSHRKLMLLQKNIAHVLTLVVQTISVQKRKAASEKKKTTFSRVYKRKHYSRIWNRIGSISTKLGMIRGRPCRYWLNTLTGDSYSFKIEMLSVLTSDSV